MSDREVQALRAALNELLTQLGPIIGTTGAKRVVDAYDAEVG
ncbi:hypothetical protein [Gordonia malaquae]